MLLRKTAWEVRRTEQDRTSERRKAGCTWVRVRKRFRALWAEKWRPEAIETVAVKFIQASNPGFMGFLGRRTSGKPGGERFSKLLLCGMKTRNELSWVQGSKSVPGKKLDTVGGWVRCWRNQKRRKKGKWDVITASLGLSVWGGR